MFENIIPLEDVDNYENPVISYHFKNHLGWEWWIIGGEKLTDTDDYYFFGVAEIITREMGFMTLSQIRDYGGKLDKDWKNKGIIKLYDIIGR